MFLRIAFRNLKRNKRRSLIVMTSIIVGVAALVLFDSFSHGMIQQMLDNQISSHVSHIQIHKKGFTDNKVVTNYLPKPDKIKEILRKTPFIRHFSERVIVFGMLSSANSSAGISLIGVNPLDEKKITTIHKAIVKGKYLTGKRNEIIIGLKMSEKLDVGIGDKLVAVSADVHGKVNSELFRIVGIYQTGSSEIDKMNVYIPIENLRTMLNLVNNTSEIAIITDNPEMTMNYKNEINRRISNSGIKAAEYEVLPYQEILTFLMSYIELSKQSIYIFYIIIASAVLFGVINSMLMSVFERINEFGVLMSIGMRNSKIFRMVLNEAFILGVAGTILGFILGVLIYLPLEKYGINLSAYSESMQWMGISSIIYPKLTIDIIINSLLFMPVATLIGAIYPARKAIKLQPTEAVRHV